MCTGLMNHSELDSSQLEYLAKEFNPGTFKI